MNTYRFEWLQSKQRGNEEVLLGTTVNRVQEAAESILGRSLTGAELALIPGLVTEKLESTIVKKDSFFAEVLKEVYAVSMILKEVRTSGGGVRK